MPRQRFKSAATSRGFKGIGQSLQASRGEIEKKTRRDVDALKLAKMQAAENAKSYIGGLTSAGNFEEKVLKEKHRIEEDVRNRQYQALSIKADRDVDRLKGEAEEAKKFADHWKDLAPKIAKTAGDFTLGALQLEDQLRGIAEWNKLYDSGELHKNLGEFSAVVRKVHGNASNDLAQVPPEEANAGLDRLRLTSKFAQRKLLAWVKENKGQIRDEVIDKWNRTATKGSGLTEWTTDQDVDDEAKHLGGVFDPYGEKTAVIAMDTAARELLRNLGIKESSNTGVAIIEQYRSLGALDQRAARLQRLFTETQTRTLDLGNQWKNAELADKPVLFNELVLAFRNGTMKINGKIQDIGKTGPMNGADATIAAIQFLADIDPTFNAANVEERLLNNQTMPLGLTGEKLANFKPESIIKKLKGSGRWESQVLNYLDNAAATRLDQKDKAKKANSYAFLVEGGEFDLLVKKVTSDKVTTLSELNQVLDMIGNADIDGNGRRMAFERINYLVGNQYKYEPDGHLANVVRHLEAGNYDQALNIFNLKEGLGLQKGEIQFLQREVKFFQDLRKVVPQTGGEQGLPALQNLVLAQFTARETTQSLATGRKVLSDSAVQRSNEAVANILTRLRASEFVTQPDGSEKPSDVPFQKRYEIESERELNQIRNASELYYNNNTGQIDYSKAKDASNPYNYIRYSMQGVKAGSILYPGAKGTADVQTEANIVAAYNSETKNESAVLDMLDSDSLIPLDAQKLKYSIDNELYGMKTPLESVRLIPPNQLKPWVTAAEKAAKGEEFEIPEWPETINVLSNYKLPGRNDKPTKIELINLYMKVQLHKQYGGVENVPQFPLRSEDQCKIQYGEGFNSRDLYGTSVWTSCAAQGLFPKTHAFANWEQGLNKEQSFFAEYPEAENNLGAALDNGAMFKMDTDYNSLIKLGIVPDPSYFKWVTGKQSTEDYSRGMEYIRSINKLKRPNFPVRYEE